MVYYNNYLKIYIFYTYVKSKKYKILEQNYTNRLGEIDIIALDEKTIVFVEVKTRTGNEWGDPQDFVTERKIRRIVMSADAYLRFNQVDMDVRFDIVSIVEKEGEFKVEHIKQAFYPPIE